MVACALLVSSAAVLPSPSRTRGHGASEAIATAHASCATTRWTRVWVRTAVTRRAKTCRGRSVQATAAAQMERTWSNPKAEVLTTVVPGRVWAAQRPFVWNGIDVGGKMAVVKLNDGSLWVHSPVALDAALADELAQLGSVEHVVAPNYEHVKYTAQWAAAYPDANVYGCPLLSEKMPQLPLTASVGDPQAAAATWPQEIEYRWLDCETNPATGQPFFNEVVFHHVPTGTLCVTDVFWNYPARDVPPQTWLWKQGMDSLYLPFYRALMTRGGGREEAYAAAAAAILKWPFDRILPCHGTVLEGQAAAHAALRAHLLDGQPQSS